MIKPQYGRLLAAVCACLLSAHTNASTFAFNAADAETFFADQFPDAELIADGVIRVEERNGYSKIIGVGRGGAAFRAAQLRERLNRGKSSDGATLARWAEQLEAFEQFATQKADVSGLRCSDWYISLVGNYVENGSNDYVATSSEVRYIGPIPGFGTPPLDWQLAGWASSTAFPNPPSNPSEVVQEQSGTSGVRGSVNVAAFAFYGAAGPSTVPYSAYAISEASYFISGCTAGFVEWIFSNSGP